MQRPFSRANPPLRTDRAVELVFDLQQGAGQLLVFVTLANPEGFVGRIGFGQRAIERPGISEQAVVAHGQSRLRLALVAQRAHAQRRGVRQVQRVGGKIGQRVLASGHKGAAHGRRRAEQIKQQPGMAPKISDQRKVRRIAVGLDRSTGLSSRLQRAPRALGQREVVVDARDRLHAAAVAVRQPVAIDRLRASDIGAAIAAQRDVLVARRQPAGHAAAPHQFVAQVAKDRLVDLRQFVLAGLGRGVHPGDQLELRFAEVGRDVRVRQGRTQACRVRGERQPAVARGAQAFLFDATQHRGQGLGRERTQRCQKTIQERSPVSRKAFYLIPAQRVVTGQPGRAGGRPHIR